MASTSTLPSPLIILAATAVESVLYIKLSPQNFFATSSLTSAFLLWGGVNVILLVLFKLFVYPNFLSPWRHLPKPKGELFLLSHGIDALSKPGGSGPLRALSNTPNDGLILYRDFFYQDRLLVTSTAILAEILVHKPYDFTKPDKVRNFLRRILGDGLIIVEGDEHKFQRKHIQPSFSFRHIKELYPSFWRKSIEFVGRINSEVRSGPLQTPNEKIAPTSVLEINQWASRVTMDIIGAAGLGREFHALINSDDELMKNYEEILEPTTEKKAYFILNILFPQALIRSLPWKINKTMRETTTNLRNICHQLLREKKELLKAQGQEQVDILSLLLKSNDFSDEQLIDQLLTFLAAGHETTSSAFTWTTYLLSVNPDIQRKVREEVKAALPQDLFDPAAPTTTSPDFNLAATLESLPYLNGVCNETLRLYPTVPITFRTAIRPTNVSNFQVPTGTRFAICPWAINRSPDIWGPSAEQFKPERWIDFNQETGEAEKPNNNGGVSSNYAIQTFLHGPRSCIGQGFAKAELRCLVAAFVASFEWDLGMKEEDVICSGVVTSKPEFGMKLKMKVLEDQ